MSLLTSHQTNFLSADRMAARSVEVSGAATVRGDLTVTGTTALSTVVAASVEYESLDVAGTLDVAGKSTLDSLEVTNGATVGTSLGVGGDLTVTGTASVGTLVAASIEYETLDVTGAATVGTTLGVTGKSTLDSLEVTNAATVGTTLGVTGKSTLSTLEVTSSANIPTLGVTNLIATSIEVSTDFSLGLETLEGAGTIGITKPISVFPGSAGGEAYTLPAGAVPNQLKLLIYGSTTAGFSAVVTPTFPLGYSTITFSQTGSSVLLFNINSNWVVVSNNGATLA